MSEKIQFRTDKETGEALDEIAKQRSFPGMTFNRNTIAHVIVAECVEAWRKRGKKGPG